MIVSLGETTRAALNWFKMSAIERETLCLEAQVFLKHKTMFKASDDCLGILNDFCECGLISENDAKRIRNIDGNKSKRNG